MPGLRKDDIPLSAVSTRFTATASRCTSGRPNACRIGSGRTTADACLGMRTSAMRRNVAEYLGIAEAKDIKVGVYRITADEAKRGRTWLDECEITWRECASESAAKTLETSMKAEYRPPLTKI
jgi:hypothetical protein